MMKQYQYGNPNAMTVLIQLVDDHDLAVIENEIAEIQRLTNADFHLLAIKVNNWNKDLSPWEAPAVFGSEPFGSGAADTLAEPMAVSASACRVCIILSAIFSAGCHKRLSQSCRNDYPQCADDEIQGMEMGTAERLSDSYFSAVYCNSAYHMERSGQPVSLYRIGVKHIGILDEQSQKYPHCKPYLRFTLLAALRCNCPFLRRNCQ